MESYVGNKFGKEEVDQVERLERMADPKDKEQAELVEKMKAQIKKLQELRRSEDPRLSFSTPEFKDAQRAFTDAFKRNFGRPVEYGLVKQYPWSAPQLVKLSQPVDVNGKPWVAGDR